MTLTTIFDRWAFDDVLAVEEHRPKPVKALLESYTVLAHPGHSDQKSHAGDEGRGEQALIDEAKTNADAGAKLDELAANETTPRVIRHWADRLEGNGLTSDEANQVREAGDAGDYDKIRSVADGIASRAGLTPIGRAGDRSKFNPKDHEPIDRGNRPRDGETIEIVRRGHDFAMGDQTIRIAKAVVERV